MSPKIAHVVVVSDNRENVKRLARGEQLSYWNVVIMPDDTLSALPSKPLNQISFSDADNASALSFVKQKLHDSGLDVKFSSAQTAYIERLGGRASDLESVSSQPTSR